MLDFLFGFVMGIIVTMLFLAWSRSSNDPLPRDPDDGWSA